MKANDIVGRVSYNKDIVFRIVQIINNTAILKGMYNRLYATALLSDLELIENKEIIRLDKEQSIYYEKVILSNNLKIKHLTGKILHLDSDLKYLRKCLNLYHRLNIYAYGIHLNEPEFKKNIIDLIHFINPDIIILTGHDSFNKSDIKDLASYQTTQHFIECIKEIRKYFSKDHIFIFAGACQSNYEALIASGANYASSPKRVNIDVYDPAIIAIKAATTSFNDIILCNKDISKENASGIESFGKMRLLL